MYHPTLEEFKALADKGNLIPVYRELLADTETPVSAFRKIDQGGYSFLLESVEGGERWARYSFLSTEPALVFRSRGRTVRIMQYGQWEPSREAADPLEELRALMKRYEPVQVDGLPRFFGGAVGFIGYDMVRFFERLPTLCRDDLDMDDAALMITRSLLIFDNIRHTIKVVACPYLPDFGDPRRAYQEAIERIDADIQRLRRPLQDTAPMELTPVRVSMPEGFQSNFTPGAFMDAVARTRDYIHAGDCIQVVLSQRFSGEAKVNPLRVYRALRNINPSPYLFYLKLGEDILVGSSPEVMVRVEGDQAVLRPIAGTRPRGRDAAEDCAMERDLLEDPKERAEHVMLVDLARNDLGRVAKVGSVRVDELMAAERYSHVMHIVSNVQARLREGIDAFDAFRATFPAGTLSGAPKVRAMEIIEELEGSRRGAYGGAVGYFGFSGNMDMCITIRTLVFRDCQVHVQAGAGIVADSRPETEYQECVNKAKALFGALEMAGEET